MSGHSKWAQIKRQKGSADAKRAQAFTKLGNAISIAARSGGDPATNFALRLAVEKAKAANMPKENIERAIKRGTGELGGQAIEDLTYEAYAPGGAGLIIKVQTDNKNRALSEIKSVLNKFGGKLASTGSVAFNFVPVGQIVLKKNRLSPESQMDHIFYSNAKDYFEDEEVVIVETEPENLEEVKRNLEKADESIEEVFLSQKPVTVIDADEETKEKVLKLAEALEELDDVSEVITNI